MYVPSSPQPWSLICFYPIIGLLLRLFVQGDNLDNTTNIHVRLYLWSPMGHLDLYQSAVYVYRLSKSKAEYLQISVKSLMYFINQARQWWPHTNIHKLKFTRTQPMNERMTIWALEWYSFLYWEYSSSEPYEHITMTQFQWYFPQQTPRIGVIKGCGIHCGVSLISVRSSYI